jgi:hypothetical protein
MIRGLHRKRAGSPVVAQVNAHDAFDIAVQFEQRGDLPSAEQAYRVADELGHGAAALNLGVLLEEKDDVEGAEEAFRRADERGDATGAFHLAWLLQERGDVAGAEAAYHRADQRGHPAAGGNLRVLLGAAAPAPESNGAAPGSLAPLPVQTPPLRTEPPTAEFTAVPRPVRPPRPVPAARSRRGDAKRPEAGAPASRAARRSAAVAAASAAAADAKGQAAREQRSEPQARSRSLLRRVLGVTLPVVAFGVAFLAGSATKDKEPSLTRLAPAANLIQRQVTVAKVAPVPKPATLATRGPAHRKPKHKAAAHPRAAVHTVAPARPVFHSAPRHSVPPASGTTTTSGSGTGTTSSASGGSSITSLSSSSGTGTVSGTG